MALHKLIVLAILTSTNALVMPTTRSIAFLPKSRCTTTTTTHLSMGEDGTTTATSSSPFDDYKMSDPTQGLEIKDVIVGDGEPAKDGDLLKVKYTGIIMASGRQFDTGKISFKLGDGEVIKGWEQGFSGMREGGTRTLRIPPALAYGEMAVGDIPGGADLEFEMELTQATSGVVGQFMATYDLGNNTRTYVLGSTLFFAVFLPQIAKVVTFIFNSVSSA
eukprot:CAMPEP_0198253778 /NCGR_PEP_ID=MMETSP1447-20131203/4158_1 /TAXON_ID=420782 /ORGANISM="Chaetoceros dichaeta, Strain CCMP1751" /LENGTH=218 /DNA_ID=CAMNT_0043939585 /DNA_START=82 /DNA_END=738 /DNA_ORIENTATION=+